MTGRALLLAALLLPGAARAGPTLALRLAFAPSFLDAADRLPMNDVISSQVPLQLDALWAFGRPLALGGYASYGIGRAGAGLCGAERCSASSVHAGAQLLWRLEEQAAGGAPWVGAGLGWEWTTARRGTGGSEISYRYSGPEGIAQAGVEWKARRFQLGPFLAIAVGSYRRVALAAAGGSASSSIGDPAFHAWVHFGVRGAIDL